MLYEELSTKIIDSVIAVHKGLGPGLLEMPYHNALYYELRARGLFVTYNAPFPVYYRGEQVGDYLADIAIENKVIIEVKSVQEMGVAAAAQLLNYLHISGYRLGFLVNFHGSKATWKRYVV
jgi:GxxExxY protein